MGRLPDHALNRVLRPADRWFRGWGVAALAALGRGGWRVPFVLAHLAVLLALLPLGIVLLVQALTEGYRVSGSPIGALRVAVGRHTLVAVLLTVVVVTVSVSLANFSGGTRWLRALANLVTVAIVLLLVVRYLRAGGATRRS